MIDIEAKNGYPTCNCSSESEEEIKIRSDRVRNNSSSLYSKIRNLIYNRSLISQTELDGLLLELSTEELIDVFYFPTLLTKESH